MKEWPYKTSFSSIIRPITSEEKDKYLALASIEKLSQFIPNITEPTLLAFSTNAFVANRVNKNDDVIDTETAIAIHKKFINSPVNIEHKRTNCLGFIMTAGFSEFGTDKPLTEEQVKTMKSPFNVVLGGVLWRVVNADITDLIEESNDPTSDKYLSYSCSWELSFSDYKIAALDEGQKNLEDAVIISDKEAVASAKDSLKCLGGTGKTSDGKHLYRMPYYDVMPLGIGITSSPAAEVKGILVAKNEGEVEKGVVAKEDKKEEIEKNISQSANNNVNPDTIEIIPMKFNSIKDITDENLKQAVASNISDLIVSEVTEKSKIWEQEKNAFQNQIKDAEAKANQAKTEYDKLIESMKTVQANLDKLNQEKEERVKVENFQKRMGEINEIYELDDEVRAAILDDVKAIASDDDFAKWKLKAAALFKPFKKGKKGEKAADCKDGEKKEEVKASTDSVIDKAIDNAEKDKAKLPNSSTTEKQTLKEKYAGAFSKENFTFKV